jgi:DNA-binding LacI/PurR family transcriptional regulator
VSVTIKDIAQAAGVSPSTVSRALNDHPRISAATKEHVQTLAQEMGYTPSALARGLVTRQTATIGVVITTASDPFLAPLVTGIEEIAHSNGYSVFLSSSYHDPERELAAVRSFYEHRTSGIIVVGSQIDEGYSELRGRFPFPIVLTNCRTYPYSVASDNVVGAHQAVEHLIQLGHRRIAYVADRGSYRANLDRLTGYRQTLKQDGVSPDRNLSVEGDGTLKGGIKAARQLLALSQPPTAFFCFNDMTAMGVMAALRRAGFRVPRDKSVVGFDDLDLASYYCPPLTTVRQLTYQIGQRAIRMLLRMIQGKAHVGPETLPCELVVRETTAPAPTLAQ